MTFTPEDFAQAATVSRETLKRLQSYAGALLRWQTKLNLVSRATLPELWHRHMLDSAQLVPHIPPDARHLADLGSGAGFPGLVVALCLEDTRPVQMDLYEVDQKKALFLQEVIRLTGVNARVISKRIEEVRNPIADCLMSRALAPLPKLFELAQHFWHPAMTGLFLKGRDVQSEIDNASRHWQFTYDRIASVTDSNAAILRIRSLSRV